jgi:hypothetical protein
MVSQPVRKNVFLRRAAAESERIAEDNHIDGALTGRVVVSKAKRINPGFNPARHIVGGILRQSAQVANDRFLGCGIGAEPTELRDFRPRPLINPRIEHESKRQIRNYQRD